MEDYDSIQKSSSQPGTHIVTLTSKPPPQPSRSLKLIRYVYGNYTATGFSFYLGVKKHRNISTKYLQKVFSSQAWILIGVQE